MPIGFVKMRGNTKKNVPEESLMLTEDENIVEVNLTVQYTVADPKAFLLNVRDSEVSLQQATESALRHVVGGSKMHSVLTEGRDAEDPQVQTEVVKALADTLALQTDLVERQMYTKRLAQRLDITESLMTHAVEQAMQARAKIAQQEAKREEATIPTGRGFVRNTRLSLLQRGVAYRQRPAFRFGRGTELWADRVSFTCLWLAHLRHPAPTAPAKLSG